jgi:hypothetical protein
MSEVRESFDIDATRSELWALLSDPASIAMQCPGVPSFEVFPEDQPFGLDTVMHTQVRFKRLSGLVVSRVIAFDPLEYTVGSEITNGPFALKGALTTQLHPVDSDPSRSRLEVHGSLSHNGGFLGEWGLKGFLLSFHLGRPVLSRNLAKMAKAQQELVQ